MPQGVVDTDPPSPWNTDDWSFTLLIGHEQAIR